MLANEGGVIVCGLGRMGWAVLEYLRALNWRIVAIDNECQPDDPRLKGVEFIRGNFRDTAVLQKAGIEQARGVLILANDDLTNLAACLEMRRLNKTVRIVVRMFNDNLVSKLGQTIHNVVALSSSRLAGPLIATTALSGDVLSRFNSSQTEWQIERITFEESSPWCGRAVAELVKTFPHVQLLNRPDSGHRIGANESLLFLGPVTVLGVIRSEATGEEKLTAKWAGRVKRLLRTLYTTAMEIEWPVKVAAYCFFAVIGLGSIICWLSGLADTLPRGLFRTLNIMVTSADLREQDYPSPWQHVFISFLKMTGLLLTATFTALLTNYLVRVRLRGVLSISRVPESGHVVLCGLGTVGFRVLEVLRRQGIPVVVLEKLEGGRFVAAARQQGATVLLADGTVPATLSRAHAGQAMSLVAATSSDLANVEIALLAREQNPKLRVIVRLDDPALAESLRLTANIRYAMDLPHLIAPAFVLPLFGDRILSLFWIEQTLHVVLEVVVDEQTQGLLGYSEKDVEKRLNCWVVMPEQNQAETLQPRQSIIIIVSADRISDVLKQSYEAVAAAS